MRRVDRRFREHVLDAELKAAQPGPLRCHVIGESTNVVRRGTKATRHVGALAMPAIDLSTERVGRNRRPDRLGSSADELSAGRLDLRRALIELASDHLEV
jgi:hypothetical protein